MKKITKSSKDNMNNWTISGRKTLKNAMEKFEKNKQGILFVVDDKKRLIGSITDGDIRRAILLGKHIGLSVRISMNPNPYAFRVKAPILDTDTLQFLRENNFLYIPVLNPSNKIIDVVSINQEVVSTKKLPHIRKKKSVLVIGGAGYIGSVLIRLLLKNGYYVKIFDSLLYGDASIKELYKHPKLELVAGDTRNIRAVNDAVNGVNTIVHLGEIVGDPACALDEEYTLSVNFTGTENIVQTAGKTEVERFIYASSCSVYGFGTKPFNEKSSVNPLSLYAKTKLECEKMILSLQKAGKTAVVLRLATVFGWSPRIRFDLVVNYFCLRAFLRKKIEILGGNQWRPFIHVQDVAIVILKAIGAPVLNVKGHILNVGGNNLNIKLQKLADLITNEFGGPEVESVKTRKDRRSYRVDFSKIEKLLNFIPTRDISNGIGEIKHYLERNTMQKKYLRYSSNLVSLAPGLERE